MDHFYKMAIIHETPHFFIRLFSEDGSIDIEIPHLNGKSIDDANEYLDNVMMYEIADRLPREPRWLH